MLKAIGKYIVELDMGKIMKIKMKIILLVGSFIILCLSSYCICARIKNFQKLKTREQTKNLWQEGEQPNYEKGKKSEDRVYEGYWELPFSEMVYAQENTVEMLRNEYKDISFEYRFPVGECKYKNYFLGLLKNDINFHEIFEEKEVYIDETGHFVTKYCTKDMKDLYYYLFDMTGDGITDLCISDEREFVYVISYDEEKKRLTLWNGFDSTWIKLNGTCAVRWDREGINQIYYEFEPNGELFRMTGFMEKEFLNKETQTGETAYIVSMPCYEGNIDSEEKWRMMHDQAYYVKDTGFYYFRVTKDQYDQLTGTYFRAEMEATHNIKKVRYTYDEVISDLE